MFVLYACVLWCMLYMRVYVFVQQFMYSDSMHNYMYKI